MTYSKKDIQNLREHARLKISTKQEVAIIKRFGTELDEKHEWSEQDIYEQTCKMLR